MGAQLPYCGLELVGDYCDARPMVTFPNTGLRYAAAGTNLYMLLGDRWACAQSDLLRGREAAPGQGLLSTIALFPN